MKCNVTVIIICFLIRAFYDFFKLTVYRWFGEMRHESAENNSWHYAVVFGVLLIIFELIPEFMFMNNLRYIMSNRIALVPKEDVNSKASKL